MSRRVAIRSTTFAFVTTIFATCQVVMAEMKHPPVCESSAAGISGSVPDVSLGMGGLNYATGFEPQEGFPLGYISNAGGTHPLGCGGIAFPCWGHTSEVNASLITPTISNANPAEGVQHLRLAHDPGTRTNQPNFGLGVDVRYPRDADLSIRPIAANTASVEVAISNPGGMNYRIQTQSFSQGCFATSALFLYDGSIHILDDLCGSAELQFIDTGASWDTTGAFQNYTVAVNPCIDSVTYAYGGQLLYISCTAGGYKLEQFLVYGDNYPGSHIDVDNVGLSSDEECPANCGNGIVERPTEQCEPGAIECSPGHTCGAVGSEGQCQCSRICTRDEPCVLTNGENGPLWGPFDASMNGYFIYQAAPGVDAVSVETCGTTGIDSNILYFGTCSGFPDSGSSNDDCCNPTDPDCGSTFGAGSDPSASCYNNVSAPHYESCTCHSNPVPGDNCYLLVVDNSSRCEEDLDAVWTITVNKKAACGQGHLGACCDTNGPDQGCTDNVIADECVDGDKVWTDQGKCADTICACIPDCTDAACGDDGCGGSCGTCDDGDICNGLENCSLNRTCDAGVPLSCNDGNACNGIESCNPSAGCLPGTPPNCNDGLFCNGTETCVPPSGCALGTPPCAKDETCDEDGDQCVPNTIPAVSDWGLLVLAIVLLVAAKIRFTRAH